MYCTRITLHALGVGAQALMLAAPILALNGRRARIGGGRLALVAVKALGILAQ